MKDKARKWPAWRKWLIAVLVSMGVLTGAAYFGLNMAVDYVLKSLISGSVSDERLAQVLDDDGDIAWLFDEEPDDEKTDVDPMKTNVEKTDDGKTRPVDGSSKDGAGSAGDRSNGVDSGASADSALHDEDLLSYSPNVTKEKAEAVQRSIKLHEKIKVASVLLNRLSSSDIDQFVKMMSGGMTLSEKKAAKKIMLERLTPEEYNELIKIAEKYGLSKGKTYEESLKE